MKLNELLDKFYSGATSRKEEELLLAELERTKDPRYEADRQLLSALCAPMPDFSLMAERAMKSRRIVWFRRLTAAASVSIVLLAGASFLRKEPQPQDLLTVDQATEQTIMALTALSDGFNRGCDELLILNDL